MATISQKQAKVVAKDFKLLIEQLEEVRKKDPEKYRKLVRSIRHKMNEERKNRID